MPVVLCVKARGCGCSAEPEFDQTLGFQRCAAQLEHAAARGILCFRRWQYAVSDLVSTCWHIVVMYSLLLCPFSRARN